MNKKLPKREHLTSEDWGMVNDKPEQESDALIATVFAIGFVVLILAMLYFHAHIMSMLTVLIALQ